MRGATFGSKLVPKRSSAKVYNLSLPSARESRATLHSLISEGVPVCKGGSCQPGISIRYKSRCYTSCRPSSDFEVYRQSTTAHPSHGQVPDWQMAIAQKSRANDIFWSRRNKDSNFQLYTIDLLDIYADLEKCFTQSQSGDCTGCTGFTVPRLYGVMSVISHPASGLNLRPNSRLVQRTDISIGLALQILIDQSIFWRSQFDPGYDLRFC
jgi:hypothetical protein